MRLSTLIGVSAALVASIGAAHAAVSNKDAAVALVQKAVAHAKKNGVDAACKDFADPAGTFIQGELYVFVQDMPASILAGCPSTIFH